MYCTNATIPGLHVPLNYNQGAEDMTLIVSINDGGRERKNNYLWAKDHVLLCQFFAFAFSWPSAEDFDLREKSVKIKCNALPTTVTCIIGKTKKGDSRKCILFKVEVRSLVKDERII